MMGSMKKFTKICFISLLCLSLAPAQAYFCSPQNPESELPVSYSPLAAAMAIASQVRDAAQRAVREAREQSEQMEQMEHLKEVMDAQEQAMKEQADSSALALSSSPLPGETGVDAGAEDAAASLVTETWGETEAETEAEAEATTEAETETGFLPAEETEAQFQPVRVGDALPDAGTSPDDGSDETESIQAPDAESESEEIDDSVMVSRHGTFSLPKIDHVNEARLNLYDYRMLREYPLSRLPKDMHALYRQLKEQVAAYDGTWSVYVQNLTTGQALVVNDSALRSASVMKLFIMGSVYEAFDRGDLPRNEDTVYLLRSMIINSSNESSNRLLTLLGGGDIAEGVAKVNEFIYLRGYSDGTIEYNGFEDPAASLDPSHPNVIMAKDVGLLLSRVYNRTFLSRKVCNEIEQMMLEQATRYKIPRGLPEGVECGNKSGETDTIANDAAVIYGPTTDYILVVLSNDWSSEDTANAQIAEVSAAVYAFFEK